MPNLEPNWVIVSGANGSIGSALADHFLARGGPVLGLDREFGGPTQPGEWPRYVKRAVDLTCEAGVSAVLDEAIPESRAIGLLVNTVGLIWNEPVVALRGARFQPHSVENWRRVIEANLTAPFVLASRVAVRMARRGGGAIVHFSSVAGRGNPGQAAYGAAK